MDITEVRVNLNKGGKVKAFAQVVLDGCFLLGDIRILEGKEGTVTVAMPSRRLRNGSYRDIAHPLNTDTRRRFDEAVLHEYQRVLEEQGDPNDGEGGSSRAQQIASRLLSDQFWTNAESDDD